MSLFRIPVPARPSEENGGHSAAGRPGGNRFSTFEEERREVLASVLAAGEASGANAAAARRYLLGHLAASWMPGSGGVSGRHQPSMEVRNRE